MVRAGELEGMSSPIQLGPGESLITVAGTNDIHGGFEASPSGELTWGGFDWFAGYISAMREVLEERHGAGPETIRQGPIQEQVRFVSTKNSCVL